MRPDGKNKQNKNMVATLEHETGAGIASPEQKPEWVTLEEAEKLEKCIGRNYTKKGDAKDAKKFFYKVTGCHQNVPAVPFSLTQAADLGSTDDFLISFEVQKYYRNEFRNSTFRDPQNPNSSREIKVNQHVESHVMKNDKWVCVDKTASFFMDSKKFLAEFERDKEE